jgi:hypothetical protein
VTLYNLTLQSCMDACLNETWCRSFDWKPLTRCHLSDKSRDDEPEASMKNLTGYTHGHRCDFSSK